MKRNLGNWPNTQKRGQLIRISDQGSLIVLFNTSDSLSDDFILIDFIYYKVFHFRTDSNNPTLASSHSSSIKSALSASFKDL